MTRRISMTAAVAALFALGACAPNGQPDTGPKGAPAATVRVTNQNWSDMNVFVVQSGVRVRLGTVTSMSSGTFRLPASVQRAVGGVRIVAAPIGGTSGFTSESIQVASGQQVALTVQNMIQASSIAVWNHRH